MAWKGFTGGVANIFPAAFQSVYIRVGTGTPEKWQTLGSISGGVLDVKDFAAPDSLTRNKGINSYDFTAKFNMMQAASIELHLVDDICNGTNDFLFKLSDAVAPAGAASAGWVMVTYGQVGAKAKLIADGAPEKNREIQIDIQGSIFKSDANEIALYKPTLAAADFASTATTATYCGSSGVGGIGVYSATTNGGLPNNAHLCPCGISAMTLDGAGLSAPDTITPINNIKFNLEMLPNQDGLRRFLPGCLDINIEVDWMATANADLLLLGNASAADVKAIFTFLDGEAFTFDNQTGLETDFGVSGDMDKNRFVKFTLKGKTLQSTIGTIAA
jgi:hypothetical protein